MTTTDRLAGLNGSVGFKAPCRVATTAAITLSGEQTIDGVAIVAGDRVLVKNQASGVDNGIYIASTGAWSRALDFDGARDARNGTLVFVTSGSANGLLIFRMTATDPLTVGSGSNTWTSIANLDADASALAADASADAAAASASAASASAIAAAASAATFNPALYVEVAGDTLTGKLVGKAFDADAVTDVASATTTDIGAAATSEVTITGVTTITGFGTSNAGIVRRGSFAGVLTLTHNATSLILPGAANITTAPGDTFVARSLGSGNWRVMAYQAAARSTLVSATQQASTSGTAIDFNTIPPWAKQITIMLNAVSLSGSDNMLVQIGDSGGIENSGYTALTSITANALSTATISSTAGFPIFASGAARNVYATLTLSLMDAATFTWTATGTGHESGGLNFSSVNGVKALSAALDRIRITTTGSNNFDAGTINVMFE